MGDYMNYMIAKVKQETVHSLLQKMLQTLCPSEYDTPISITGGCFLCGMKKGSLFAFSLHIQMFICVFHCQFKYFPNILIFCSFA